jgi:type II secretory ATPase GspE/PulE/Tfp pilus assembly ATPase PilB-like protein
MSLQERAIAYLKDALSDADKAEFERELLQSETLRTELQRSRETLDILEAASDAAISRLANSIVQQALSERASDIHLVPERRSIAVKYRIDGRLRETMRLPMDYHHPLVDRFKTMAECNVNERKLPQDGRVSVDNAGKAIEMRVTFLPTVYGERMTARLIDRRNLQFGLEHCGLSQDQLEAILRLISVPNGLIFVAGSFASGKTTMLYSLLKAIQERAGGTTNIMTVEDPAEIAVDGWTQTAVDRKAGLTFAVLQRVLLRNDPDVIMVGEIRDLESLQLIMESAITGHLVLSQLHVPSAADVATRLHDMGIGSFLVAQKLAGAIGMRLVPKVCPHCPEEYAPDPKLLRHAGLSSQDGPFHHGKGCGECLNRGWRGRVPLFEILEATDDFREMLATNAGAEAVWQATFGAHGGSLWDDARTKILAGQITVERAAEALFDYPHSRAT